MAMSSSSSSSIPFSFLTLPPPLRFIMPFMVMSPAPISPLTLNLTPCFVAEMVTVSPMADRSRQMRWNSVAGISMTVSYSVSGIPSCSWSMSLSLSSKLLYLFWSIDSKMKLTTSPSLWAWMLSESLLVMHFRILLSAENWMPRHCSLSHRYCSNPLSVSCIDTNDTCELSMPWNAIILPSTMKLPCSTNSDRADTILRNNSPFANVHSNMVTGLGGLCSLSSIRLAAYDHFNVRVLCQASMKEEGCFE